jgi:ubiquinone/menaquinone biosynthesis C-methylase UbiE
MKQRKVVGLVFCVLATLLVALAPSAWAVEASVPKSSETEKLGLVPYVPTPHEVVAAMIKMADVKSTDVVFDLGCGDGRIVVAAAKRGARAYGVDIDAARVKEAKALAKKEGVQKKATIMLGDVFKTDFSSATVITMYLLPEYNRRLRPKLERVLPVGARVVSHDFNMPNWKAEETKEIKDSNGGSHTVYLWKITPEIKKRAAAREKRKAREGKRKKKAKERQL